MGRHWFEGGPSGVSVTGMFSFLTDKFPSLRALHSCRSRFRVHVRKTYGARKILMQRTRDIA